MSIRSTDSASSARSIRDSILSLWSHDSEMEKILRSGEGSHRVGSELQIDHSRASRLIEDFLYPAAADDECGDDETAKSWSTNDDSGYASGEHLSAPSSANPMSNPADHSLSPASPTNTERGDSSHQNRRLDTVRPSLAENLSQLRPLKTGIKGAMKVSNFQPFRVGVEDPCSKVLSDAFKKYDVHADSRLWSLWLIDGDQERCLGLNEKPLIIFRELTKEGRASGFVLRRYAQPVENQFATKESTSTPSPTQPLSKSSLSRSNAS